jgi:hypothetical protein
MSGGVFGTPSRVRAGNNPDGTPRYITFNQNEIAENLLPFGVSLVMVANALAKKALGA